MGGPTEVGSIEGDVAKWGRYWTAMDGGERVGERDPSHLWVGQADSARNFSFAANAFHRRNRKCTRDWQNTSGKQQHCKQSKTAEARC